MPRVTLKGIQLGSVAVGMAVVQMVAVLAIVKTKAVWNPLDNALSIQAVPVLDVASPELAVALLVLVLLVATNAAMLSVYHRCGHSDEMLPVVDGETTEASPDTGGEP